MNFDLVKLGKTASVLFLALAMAGCGGGSGDSGMVVPPPTSVDLMGSTDLMAGTTTVPAGSSVTVGDTTVSCAAGGDDCTLTVTEDSVTGAYMATSTGGEVTVAVAEPPPPPTVHTVDLMGSTDVMAGTTTIAAGASTTIGRTTISCPAGGDDCTLTVTEDAVTGAYMATSTGGEVTVAVADPPAPPPVHTVDLMGSTDLMAGTTTIAAGASTTIGRTTISCPAGGDDCVVTVAMDDVTGGMTATSTGGEATVAVADPPAPPPVHVVDLMGSTDVMAGTTTIAAGASTTIGRTTISCPAGGDDCVVTVAMDDVTGGMTATSTGGAATVAVAEPPPVYVVDLMSSTDLMAGVTTIPAGTSVTVGRTTIECPAGGDDCVLTVSADAVTGMMAGSATGAQPTVTVAPIVHYADLPKKHGLMDGDTFTVDAGDTHEMGGVEFECPDSGGDCVVTIMENDDGDLVASYTGGDEGLAATQLTPTGYLAFIHPRAGASDLSDTLLDATQLADLRNNNFHVLAAAAPATSVAGRMYNSADTGGAGVTSSVTTHEDPDPANTNPNIAGVSDIMVSVVTTATDPTSDDDSHRIVVVNTGDDGTLAAPATTVENAVLKDGSTAWNGSLAATATWAANPAAGWMTGALPSADTVNMDSDPNDIWTHYFQHEQSLAGGRTLMLDLRSDFAPGANTHREYDATQQTIVRGPGGTHNEVTVAWTDVMSMDPNITFPLGTGTEVDLSTDGGVGLEGSYMGVAGRFVCVDGGADGGTADGECKIDHQSAGRMGVSEEDTIVFLPYIHGNDVNWLAAGVWLTIPHDEENGDYAVGSFVFGNDPVMPTAADARALTGNQVNGAANGVATYSGEAFGKYAENGMIDAQAMMVGRFTADVALTADFDAGGGAAAGTGNDFGTIRGDVTNFVADGEARDWDVNFETAIIMLESDGATPPQPVDGTALRFSGTASGHGDGGKATTGYWNGQFYGNPANNDDNPILADSQPPWLDSTLPGSAAGTFGLTSERDATDNYLLVMEGAFAAHQPPPE